MAQPSAPKQAPAQGQQEEEDRKQRQQEGPGRGSSQLTQPERGQVPGARGVGNGVSGGGQDGAQADALDALRQEQARLKAEYDRMEVRRPCFLPASHT